MGNHSILIFMLTRTLGHYLVIYQLEYANFPHTYTISTNKMHLSKLIF